MVIYKSPKLQKLEIHGMIKVYINWYNKENNRVKKQKIYSACMNQFIRMCKHNNWSNDFNYEWGYYTYWD